MSAKFLFLFFISSLSPGLGSVGTRTAVLTDGAAKSWSLYSQTPAGNCSSITMDNSYTFHSDGTFTFDHGAVIRNSSCVGESCCSDMVNIIGTWRFSEDEQTISIKGLRDADDPSNAFNVTLFEGTIAQLDENVLKINQKNPGNGIVYTFEFRKK